MVVALISMAILLEEHRQVVSLNYKVVVIVANLVGCNVTAIIRFVRLYVIRVMAAIAKALLLLVVRDIDFLILASSEVTEEVEPFHLVCVVGMVSIS